MPHRAISSIIRNQSVATAKRTQTVRAAAQIMAMQHIGALLVVDENNLVGIFTERDALFRVIAEGLDPNKTRVDDVMTRDPQTITADKPLGHALHMMYEGGFRHVPVVRDGHPIGIVSTRDALGPELREFVTEMETREHIGEIL